MRKTILFGILVVLPAAIVSGGSLLSCSDLQCATGTHESGGKCIANLENECGPGTISQAGQCVVVPTPCGVNTAWNFDAGQCEGKGGGGDDDGGTPAMRGARWTGFKMIKPEAISTLANLQLPGYFADGTIVIILRTEPLTPGTSVYLHGGDGVKTSDDPLAYTFRDGLVPNRVFSTLGTVHVGADGKSYTFFETNAEFDMNFQFIVDTSNPQPPLYLYKTSITGNLDPEMIPTSNDPTLSGTIKGCFTPTTLEPGKWGAADVYIDVLQQDLKQLLDSSGAALDADCTDSGGNNGYALEGQWEALEVMDLTEETAPTDGGVQEDAAVQDDAT